MLDLPSRQLRPTGTRRELPLRLTRERPESLAGCCRLIRFLRPGRNPALEPGSRPDESPAGPPRNGPRRRQARRPTRSALRAKKGRAEAALWTPCGTFR